jgi:large subunit ribosomal protein L1
MAHGKRFLMQHQTVQRDHLYPPAEAISLIKETASAKFDESVELHLLLGVNVRHAEEQLRGTLALPHGLGKDVSVAVFAQGQQARDAESAGADFVGGDDLAEKVEEGWTDFDVAIATPQMMGTVGKLGRVLGPQGKMPNPKVGTVTDDVEKAVSDAKAGKVEYRTDRQAIIHMTIGKASFDADKLLDNYTAVIEEIVRAKPSAAKGKYIRSATLTTSMGPGIKVDAGKAGDSPEGPSKAAAEPEAPAEAEPEVEPETDAETAPEPDAAEGESAEEPATA